MTTTRSLALCCHDTKILHNDNCSNYWLDSTYYTFHTCDRKVCIITVVYKAYESHLPKEKWTWLHFLPSSVPFLTPTICGWIQIPLRNLPSFTNTCISGCAYSVATTLASGIRLQGPRKAGIEKGFQRKMDCVASRQWVGGGGSGRVSQGQTAGVPTYSCCSALCSELRVHMPPFLICGFSQLSLFISRPEPTPETLGPGQNNAIERTTVSPRRTTVGEIGSLDSGPRYTLSSVDPAHQAPKACDSFTDVVFRFPEECGCD